MDRKHALLVCALAMGVTACRSQTPSDAGSGVGAPDVQAVTPVPPAGSGGSSSDPFAGMGQTSGTGGSAPMTPTPTDAGGMSIASDAAVAPAPLTVTTEPTDEATYIFDQTQVRTYNLIIAPADLATIDGNPEAEMYVPAMLDFEGKTYGPLSVRYKGAVGAWRPPCVLAPGNMLPKAGKCSIKVAFDKPDDTARFFGVKKLNFHAMNPDASMLRERLGYALFREMGVAAPRAMHARLLINGRLEGLFIVVEDVDGQFTRARFSDGGKGNLYKEIWPMHDDPNMYIQALQNNPSAATVAGVQKMVDFKKAIEADEQSAEAWLDRDYLARYIAVDRVTINDDGAFHWWCEWGAQGHNTGMYGNHNYYWYEARGANQMWLIPWDLDTTFDGFAENRIELQWDKPAACMCVMNSQGTTEWPASCDQLTKYFISWSKEYEAMMDMFIAGPFAPTAVEAKLNEWTMQIDPAVAEVAGIDLTKYLSWKDGVTQFKATIDSARMHRGYAY